MEQLKDYLQSREIPFVIDDRYLFTCGFVFYQFQETLACNNPKGSQLLHITLDDAEKLIKRQIRKVPMSLKKPFWRH